jgi:phosphoribosylformylglycinamidine cyclo-ligase
VLHSGERPVLNIEKGILCKTPPAPLPLHLHADTMPSMAKRGEASITYADAGVSIDKAAALVDRIKVAAARTQRSGAIGGPGGFGALFDLKATGYRDPILVSGADGVGTKVKLAIETGRHDDIGVDLVAMSVNDLIVQGAEPLFFLDYFACGRLDVDVAERVVRGIARGCELAGCALVGGETAEMPGLYRDGDYDLAGFAVGAVERDGVIDGSGIRSGDAILALASSGVHSNGYSLVRRVLAESGTVPGARFGDRTFADVLLAPTRIYARSMLEAIGRTEVRGIAHITGGGLIENVPRILPEGLAAEFDTSTWKWPEIFRWLQRTGNIETREMYRTFNCGIGLVAIVDPAEADAAIHMLGEQGETVWRAGTIVATGADGQRVTFR